MEESRGYELLACNVIISAPLMPFGAWCGTNHFSFWLTMLIAILFTAVAKKVVHGTWLYVDPEFYWKYRKRFSVYVIVSYLAYLAALITN